MNRLHCASLRAAYIAARFGLSPELATLLAALAFGEVHE